MKANALMIIDPQNDFCDQRGSLYVDGAAADMSRLARHVEANAGAYSDVFVSLDSHDAAAIFHPMFWLDSGGAHPDPFTAITPGDYISGVWRAASRDNAQYAERLFRVYSEKRIDALMIWPEHCLVSTWGHQIADSVREALKVWREASGRAVRYVFKGENPYTEQFSAFEGVDASWEDCAFNGLLYARLAGSGSVTFAGEALSHCVEATIASYLDRLERDGREQSVYLIADCASPVAGFDRGASEERLASRGVRLIRSEDPLCRR